MYSTSMLFSIAKLHACANWRKYSQVGEILDNLVEFFFFKKSEL